MQILVVTGSMGLVGSTAVLNLAADFDLVIGIDNDARAQFFGSEASGRPNLAMLRQRIPNYRHTPMDIRDETAIEEIFKKYNQDIALIIHAAAQPSHDFAASNPPLDFSINTIATHYLLECFRKYSSSATFIFMSTNKVYGDRPNLLPYEELETRWELPDTHPFYKFGISESMSIDQSTHSLFGVSKASADLMVQEYGRYFGLNTGVFRGGCLTGPQHGGAELHGFLSYLTKALINTIPYTIYGHLGKQVRDNLHCFDLVQMFAHFHQAPRPGQVYNVGGGRHSHCSMLEAISMLEAKSGQKLNYSVSNDARVGDHRWWVSDIRKFQKDYPKWEFKYDLNALLDEMLEAAAST